MSQQATLAGRSAIVEVFDSFRDELDEHNDRRERLIKVRIVPWHPSSLSHSTVVPLV